MNCQDHLYRKKQPKEVARRWFLEQCGVGLGAAAFGQLLVENGLAAPASAEPADPLAPKPPQFPAKAKRMIYLFMAGAPSHLELFDCKPQLAKFDRTLPPADLLKGYRAALLTRIRNFSARSSSTPNTGRAVRKSPKSCRTCRR